MKFSITIPAYKATYFQECIESVLSQTYDDYEVVILNDCSPENIKEIVEECRKRKNGDKIRYYENEKNVGAIDVVDNWNKLLELVKGDYMICMGDDDKLAPNCLEEYCFIMDKYPNLDIYHGRVLIIDIGSIPFDIQEERPEYESVYSMIWHRTFKNRIQYVGDYLFKVSSLRERGGFFKLPLAWESDCVTSFIAAGKKGIANVSKPIFYYRSTPISITNSGGNKKKMEATMLYEKWLYLYLKSIPLNNIDKIYRKQLLEHAKERIIHNEVFMIAIDISVKPLSNFVYWLKNYKLYGLGITDFLYSCLLGVGFIIKNR